MRAVVGGAAQCRQTWQARPLMVDSDRGRAGNYSGVVARTFWRRAGWCPSQNLLVHARIVTKCVAASDHPSSIETCTTSAASPQIGHHAAESMVSFMANRLPKSEGRYA